MKVWREKEKQLEEGEIQKEEEEETWEQPKRRHGRGGRFGEESTTFFLSNLPENASVEEIREECGRCGQLVDVYVAGRKDKYGSFFAFARFANVRNIDMMSKTLRNVRIQGRKLWAKESWFRKEVRYKKPGGYDNRGKNDHPINHTRMNINGGHNLGTYKDVLTGGSSSKEEVKNVDLVVEEIEKQTQWLGRSVVGRALDLSRLVNMKECLQSIKLSKMELRYLGGLGVLITFGSSVEANQFLTEWKEYWAGWLASATLWEEKSVSFERVGWLKIIGLPPELWNSKSVGRISEAFGTVVLNNETQNLRGNLSFTHVGVIVKSGKRINEEVVVAWGNREIRCWVTEDAVNWTPDFADGDTTIIDRKGVEDGVEKTEQEIPDLSPTGTGEGEKSQDEKDKENGVNDIMGNESQPPDQDHAWGNIEVENVRENKRQVDPNERNKRPGDTRDKIGQMGDLSVGHVSSIYGPSDPKE